MCCLMMVSAWGSRGRFTLVIDAGHGGHDAGALGAVSKEKNINLAVALQFGKYVEQNMPDVKVVYTRKTDVFVPLHDRASIANRANADLFISVHTNALPAGKIARGFETYTLGMHRVKDNLDVAMRENSVISMEQGYEQTYQGFDPNSSESYIIFEFIQGKNMERSVDLARMIQRSVCSGASRPDKGVHQAGFLVLRETSMPSCLIELGFITTPDEENLLNDASRVSDIAKGIYEAFAKYRNKYDKSVSVPYRATAKEETQMPRIVPETYSEPASASSAGTSASTSTSASSGPSPSPSQVSDSDDDAPVFKLQIFVSDRKLRKGDNHFKGETDFDSYQEGKLVKYTMGSSTNYNEVYSLRKKMLDKFPEAFIIAFKGGQKYDVNQAIREFKQNKNK